MFIKKSEVENYYQVLLIQMFIFWKIDGVTAGENSGKGRYNFGFPNKYKNKIYILIEVKFSNTEYSLHEDCNDAIEQIEKKEYEDKHRENYSSILKYGIAFYKRTCRVEMKINDGKFQSPSEDSTNNNNKKK